MRGMGLLCRHKCRIMELSGHSKQKGTKLTGKLGLRLLYLNSFRLLKVPQILCYIYSRHASICQHHYFGNFLANNREKILHVPALAPPLTFGVLIFGFFAFTFPLASISKLPSGISTDASPLMSGPLMSKPAWE